MAFDLFRDTLDPDTQREFTIPVECNEGEALVSANASFVQADGTTPATGTTPSIVATVFGQVSGNDYGVTIWLNGNSAPPGFYYLRVHGSSNSTPPRSFDHTMRLRVAHT